MVHSSLPFEVLLYFNYYYLILFIIGECILYIFKITHLPYSSDAILVDSFILKFFCSIQFCRIHTGRKGNLTGKNSFIVVSLLLTVPSFIGILYILFIQLKVLRLEVIFCYIEIVLELSQVVFGLLHLCAGKRNKY